MATPTAETQGLPEDATRITASSLTAECIRFSTASVACSTELQSLSMIVIHVILTELREKLLTVWGKRKQNAENYLALIMVLPFFPPYRL